MTGVAVSQLSPRLGAHYLFSHVGRCEHIIVFTDCRLTNPVHDAALLASASASGVSDSSISIAGANPNGMLPFDGRGIPVGPGVAVLAQARYPRRRCAGCQAAFARLVVYGDPCGVANPEYYCLPCFEALHGPVAAHLGATGVEAGFVSARARAAASAAATALAHANAEAALLRGYPTGAMVVLPYFHDPHMATPFV